MIKNPEDRFIDRLKEVFPLEINEIMGIGDDCAIFDGFIITTDLYIEGTHFLPELNPFDIGWRCFAGALSDIASMGGKPLFFLMAIGGTDTGKLEDVIPGVQELAKEFNVELIGGDTVGSEKMVLCFTVIGKAERPILRKGAKPGEYIYITGSIGGARTGPNLLFEGKSPTEKFLHPVPRIREAREMTMNYRITSMIDISDGLIIDAWRLSEAGEIKLHIESRSIPISPEAVEFCKNRDIDPLNFSINSGEEYELLFTSPEEIHLSYVRKIGKVLEGKGVCMDGKPVEPDSFQHFREGI